MAEFHKAHHANLLCMHVWQRDAHTHTYIQRAYSTFDRSDHEVRIYFPLNISITEIQVPWNSIKNHKSI